MNDNDQPISAARAAALLAELVPAVARVELFPQWSDGSGETVRTTRMTAYDGEGRIIELMPVQRSMALDTVLRVAGVDWDRPQSLDVAAGTLALTYPVVPSLPVPLWSSPLAADPYRVAQLEAQRHELEDAAEPPRAVADPASDFARSVRDGFVQLPDWGDDPQSAPARPVADVETTGGVL